MILDRLIPEGKPPTNQNLGEKEKGWGGCPGPSQIWGGWAGFCQRLPNPYDTHHSQGTASLPVFLARCLRLYSIQKGTSWNREACLYSLAAQKLGARLCVSRFGSNDGTFPCDAWLMYSRLWNAQLLGIFKATDFIRARKYMGLILWKVWL